MKGESCICPKCGSVWYELNISEIVGKIIQCPFCRKLLRVCKKHKETPNRKEG